MSTELFETGWRFRIWSFCLCFADCYMVLLRSIRNLCTFLSAFLLHVMSHINKLRLGIVFLLFSLWYNSHKKSIISCLVEYTLSYLVMTVTYIPHLQSHSFLPLWEMNEPVCSRVILSITFFCAITLSAGATGPLKFGAAAWTFSKSSWIPFISSSDIDTRLIVRSNTSTS